VAFSPSAIVRAYQTDSAWTEANAEGRYLKLVGRAQRIYRDESNNAVVALAAEPAVVRCVLRRPTDLATIALDASLTLSGKLDWSRDAPPAEPVTIQIIDCMPAATPTRTSEVLDRTLVSSSSEPAAP